MKNMKLFIYLSIFIIVCSASSYGNSKSKEQIRAPLYEKDFTMNIFLKDVNLENATLEEMTRYLNRQVGMTKNFHSFHFAYVPDEITSKLRFTLKAKDVRLSVLLDAISEKCEYYYVGDQRTIVFGYKVVLRDW